MSLLPLGFPSFVFLDLVVRPLPTHRSCYKEGGVERGVVIESDYPTKDLRPVTPANEIHQDHWMCC